MKHTHKFILDAVMAIILVLLYKKLVISLAFHEIAGLILFVLFAVHLIVNRKWIRAVALSLNNRSIPVKTKVCYVVDILLLICWVFAGLSGCLCPQMDTYDTAQVCQLIILLSAHSIWCTAITLPICCAFSKIKGHAAG